MKIEITGNIHLVSEPKTAGNSEVTNIVINKKVFNFDTGELVADELFPVQIWKDDMPAFYAATSEGTKVKVEGYLNGKKYSVEGRDDVFFLQIVGKKFTAIK